MTIVVIGAGLAGLTAAHELGKAGYRPLVLEARDRVGGRTWSHRVGDEFTERGAEFITVGDHAVRGLAAELELPMIAHGTLFARRQRKGVRPTAEDLESAFAALAHTRAEMERNGASRLSFAAVAEESFGAGYPDQPVFRRVTTSLGADPADVSAAALLSAVHVERFVAHESRLLDGNQALALALAAGLPTPVRTDSPVRRVEPDGHGYQVEMVDGERIAADSVVIAVPLPLLDDVIAPLSVPDRVREALGRVRMGSAAKLAVPLAPNAEIGGEFQSDGDGYWWWWQSLARDGEHRVPFVTAFAGGTATLDALGVAAGTSGWLEALGSSVPTAQRASEAIMTDWPNDPWARGSYSYPSLDWQPGDPELLQSPFGGVVLAGEHTGMSQSMNGAILSGRRAASAILRVIRRS